MTLANLKPWPKGVSGNTSGRPPLPAELRGILSLSQPEVIKTITKFARMNMNDLISAQQNRDTSTLHLAIIAIFIKSIEKGDHSGLSFLLDRAIGKIPEIIDPEDETDERKELKKLSLRECAELILKDLAK